MVSNPPLPTDNRQPTTDNRSTAPVLYLCRDTARNPNRSGIQTVVRSLAAAFGAMDAPVQPAIWQRSGDGFVLRRFPAAWSIGLGVEPLREPAVRAFDVLRQPAAWLPWVLAGGDAEKVPLHRLPRRTPLARGTWVLMPELLYPGESIRQVLDFVHRQGWRMAVILHDTIPVHYPEFVPAQLATDHAAYLRAISRADLILPNSEFTAAGWREFLAKEGLPAPPAQTCTLACDLPGIPRVRTVPPPPPATAGEAAVRLLCVSTLEPRKNHRALLAAYELAAARRPDLRLELDLVGGRYVEAGDIADAAQALVARFPGRVRWHERVEHHALQRFYAGCDFTVYPSVLEGFGLPVIESLWFGRPCVCANFGVMAENAAGGGCLTTDVRDPAALADAILQLATNLTLRRQLATEATTRHLKTWHEYATEILAALGQGT